MKPSPPRVQKFDEITIVDPVCIASYGHNLVAAQRYSKLFENLNIKPTLYASRFLAPDLIHSSSIAIKPFFTHYYSNSIFSEFIENDKLTLELDQEHALGLDQLTRHIACKELFALLNELNSRGSALFYPSIDYYSLYALVQLGESLLLDNLKAVYIRWIGVMENCQYQQNPTLSTEMLIKRLGNLQAIYPNIFFAYSAESKNYAEYIQSIAKVPVSVTPTLVHSHGLPYEDQKFTISFPGSPREDKGFFRIPNILKSLNDILPDMDYLVYLQMLVSKSDSSRFSSLMSEIVSDSRIRMLPHTVSQAQLIKYIRKSTILVLPYCSDVYAMRSSAMLAEAACYGRQIVASSNCGFSSDVESLQIGLCGGNDNEIALNILHYYSMSKNCLEEKTCAARLNYLKYCKLAYSQFFGFDK